MSDIIGLPPEEILLELLRVNHRGEVSLHLCLPLQEGIKMLMVLHRRFPSVGGRDGARDMGVLGSQKDFVEPWSLLPLSALEKVGACSGWSF